MRRRSRLNLLTFTRAGLVSAPGSRCGPSGGTSPSARNTSSRTSLAPCVYRHQLRPVLLGGAVTMDRIFVSGAAHPES